MIDEHPCPLQYGPLARPQSSIRKDMLSIAWAIWSKDDLMLLISPSTTPTLVEMLGSSLLSPSIVRKLVETLISIDTGSRKDE